MKTCKKSRGKAPLLLNLGARWREVVNITSRPLYPLQITLVLMARWVPELLWIFEKREKSVCQNSPCAGHDILPSENRVRLVLDFGARWRWVVSFTLQPIPPPGCRPRPQSEWLCNGRFLSFSGNEPLFLLCYGGIYIHVSAARIQKNFKRKKWGCRGVLCFCVSPTLKWLFIQSFSRGYVRWPCLKWILLIPFREHDRFPTQVKSKVKTHSAGGKVCLSIWAHR